MPAGHCCQGIAVAIEWRNEPDIRRVDLGFVCGGCLSHWRGSSEAVGSAAGAWERRLHTGVCAFCSAALRALRRVAANRPLLCYGGHRQLGSGGDRSTDGDDLWTVPLQQFVGTHAWGCPSSDSAGVVHDDLSIVGDSAGDDAWCEYALIGGDCGARACGRDGDDGVGYGDGPWNGRGR